MAKVIIVLSGGQKWIGELADEKLNLPEGWEPELISNKARFRWDSDAHEFISETVKLRLRRIGEFGVDSTRYVHFKVLPDSVFENPEEHWQDFLLRYGWQRIK